MTRQVRTSDERTQVNDDFDTFQLPVDASLNLGIFGAYGTTDTSVGLSLINKRHLDNYTQFRGLWVQTPRDTPDPDNPNSMDPEIPYVENDVVYVAGMTNIIYRRTDMGLDQTPPQNPDPASADNMGHWIAMGVQVNPGVQTNDGSQVPGLYVDPTTQQLNFRGYHGTGGITVDNMDGSINLENMSITDVHVFTTGQNRNAGIEAGNTAATPGLRWHVGDVAVVTTDTNPSTTPSGTEGQGTYIYTGTVRDVNTSNNADWTELSLPTDVVRSVAGITGPTRANPSAQEIADAVDSLINLDELGNVEDGTPTSSDRILVWNPTANSGAGEWQPSSLAQLNIRGYTYDAFNASYV